MRISTNYLKHFLNISTKIKKILALSKNSEIKYKGNNLDGVHVIPKSSGKRTSWPSISRIICI